MKRRSIRFLRLPPDFVKVASRFILSGAINTLLTFGLYWLLLRVMHYQVAYAISFFAGLVVSYLLNALFVFRVAHSWGRMTMFPLVYLASYAVGAVLLDAAVDVLGMDQRIAPLLSIAATLPLTFVLTRLVLTGRARGSGTGD